MDLRKLLVNSLPFSINLCDVTLIGKENSYIFMDKLNCFDKFIVMFLWDDNHFEFYKLKMLSFSFDSFHTVVDDV